LVSKAYRQEVPVFSTIQARVLSSVRRFVLGLDRDGLPPRALGTGTVAELEPYGTEPPWETREVPERRESNRTLPGGRRAEDKWRDGTIAGPPVDRRKEPRYIPLGRRAYVGWWAGEAFQTAEAEADNISRGGAALRVGEFPPEVGAVWVCPIGPGRPDWYAARVIAVEEREGMGRVVRVSLAEPLGYDLFKSVVWGFPATSQVPQQSAGCLGKVLSASSQC
jgi:hypothetical protein